MRLHIVRYPFDETADPRARSWNLRITATDCKGPYADNDAVMDQRCTRLPKAFVSGVVSTQLSWVWETRADLVGLDAQTLLVEPVSAGGGVHRPLLVFMDILELTRVP